MVKRNKDGAFPFLGCSVNRKSLRKKLQIEKKLDYCILSPFRFEVMVLQNSSFLEKQQTKPSGAPVTEVIIILHINVLNPLKFKSNNSKAFIKLSKDSKILLCTVVTKT